MKIVSSIYAAVFNFYWKKLKGALIIEPQIYNFITLFSFMIFIAKRLLFI